MDDGRSATIPVSSWNRSSPGFISSRSPSGPNPGSGLVLGWFGSGRILLDRAVAAVSREQRWLGGEASPASQPAVQGSVYFAFKKAAQITDRRIAILLERMRCNLKGGDWMVRNMLFILSRPNLQGTV